MSKIPERFVGYAFCVGDLLLELDRDFTILSADGASQSLLGKVKGPLVGKNFMSLMGQADRKIVETSTKMLGGKMRIGPLSVKVGASDSSREPFSIFLGSLPMRKDRLYLVMTRPHRLGMKPEADAPSKPLAESKAEFFSNLESLFASAPEAQDNMLVTVLQSVGKTFSENQQVEVERYLRSVSVGGNLATRLSADKFALVHDKGDDGTNIEQLTQEISQATGVKIDSATIDAQDAKLAEEDSLKALVFSLQQFTRAKKGFAIKDLKTECGKMIGDSTKKVKEFRQILRDGAFSLVFQPIVDFKTGRTHHFEALSRLQLSSDINASPFEMITFAEDVGLIDEFDLAVIRRAIAKLIESEKTGYVPKLAVNVSGRSLSDQRFIKRLLLELHNADRYRDNLSLEVTESARIDDLTALGRVLTDVRNAGFKVYLDDFGAGAAGFQYLRELQVDALKIDGAYIRNAVDSAKDRAFLKSMVTLCKDLGIETVGEWVETHAHAQLLKELGVDYGQGYFFGKPVSGLVPARAGLV